MREKLHKLREELGLTKRAARMMEQMIQSQRTDLQRIKSVLDQKADEYNQHLQSFKEQLIAEVQMHEHPRIPKKELAWLKQHSKHIEAMIERYCAKKEKMEYLIRRTIILKKMIIPRLKFQIAAIQEALDEEAREEVEKRKKAL